MRRAWLLLCWALCLFISALALPGCWSAQAAAADAIGRGVNVAVPSVIIAYEQDCGGDVDAAAPGEARHALAACRVRWRTVWVALEVLRDAHDAWIAAIGSGRDGDWAQLVDAACAVSRGVAAVAPEVRIPVLAEVCP